MAMRKFSVSVTHGLLRQGFLCLSAAGVKSALVQTGEPIQIVEPESAICYKGTFKSKGVFFTHHIKRTLSALNATVGDELTFTEVKPGVFRVKAVKPKPKPEQKTKRKTNQHTLRYVTL